MNNYIEQIQKEMLASLLIPDLRRTLPMRARFDRTGCWGWGGSPGGKGSNNSTSPDGPGLGKGSVRSGSTVRSDWTEPKTGSLGLDGLGLNQSAHACNFDIVSQSCTTENMTLPHIYHRTPLDIHSGWNYDSSVCILGTIEIYFPQ